MRKYFGPAAAVVGGAVLALAGCTLFTNGDPAAPPTDPATSDVFSLSVGDCITNSGVADEIESLPTVPCGSLHDAEVYSIGALEDGDFPEPGPLSQAAELICGPEFVQFIGRSYVDSRYDFSYYVPTAQSWAAGDRVVVCVAFADDQSQLTGTLKGVDE